MSVKHNPSPIAMTVGGRVDSAFIQQLVKSLPRLPAGTIVVFNVETGDYVTAVTESGALDAFGDKYGWGVPAAVYVVRH